jgi:pSer/pThr/pTyr-binding forkhead associated (FHA) protein
MVKSAARLEVIAGKALGMSIVVDDELSIGRQAEGAGRLAEDDEISRLHARVSLDASGFCAIEDVGSTNGTFVNGLRISGPKTLSAGDTIEVGATTLVVREVPGSAETDAPGSAPAPTPEPEGEVGPPPAGQETPTTSYTPGPPPIPEQEPEAEPVEPEPDAGGPLPEPVVPAAPLAPLAPLPPLVLRLEVDFENHEARLRLNDASEPVRFTPDSGTWRLDLSPTTDEGGPQ